MAHRGTNVRVDSRKNYGSTGRSVPGDVLQKARGSPRNRVAVLCPQRLPGDARR